MASIIKAVGYTSSAVRFFRNYNSTPVDTYRLEPLSTIMKLAIYTYKPIGTKIGIYDNYIWFQKPDLFQGTKRALYGQDREKICLLREPISSACHWYLKRNNSGEDNKKVKELKYIFTKAIEGLHKISLVYKDNGFIDNSIRLYTRDIQRGLNGKNPALSEDSLTEMDKEFTKLWSDEQISCVYNLLVQLERYTEEEKIYNLTTAVEKVIQNVDDEINKIVSRTTTT